MSDPKAKTTGPAPADATVPVVRPEAADTQKRRRAQARHAVRLWGGITLSGIAVLGGLTAWHLRRRLRLLHDRASPPRRVEWPEPEDHDAGRTSP